MKKQLLSICASAALLMLVGKSFGQYDPPVRTMVIPFATGPVTIDGISDEEFYSEEQTTYIFDPAADKGSLGTFDLTAVFKICYDVNNLYIQANITDGVVAGEGNSGNDPWTSMAPGDSWQFDNSEVFFDLDTNGVYNVPSATAYDSTCVQLRINRSRDSLMTASANTHELPLIDPKRATGKTYNDGDAAWMYEWAIPWTAMTPKGITDATPWFVGTMKNGFDLSVGDADIIGGVHVNRSRQAAWDTETGGEATWSNRTQMGVVTMAPVIGITNTTVNNLVVSPNPTTGVVRISDLNSASVQVINLEGQTVLNVLNSNIIDMSQLANGMYLVKAGQSTARDRKSVV